MCKGQKWTNLYIYHLSHMEKHQKKKKRERKREDETSTNATFHKCCQTEEKNKSPKRVVEKEVLKPVKQLLIPIPKRCDTGLVFQN